MPDTKTMADTFLYSKAPDYNKQLLKFITSAERIDTKSSEFGDILFDIKRRRISDSLAKIATSNSVVIGIGETPLPKALRVFVAKDLKDGGKYKVFLDATEYIKKRSGSYDCVEINWLISYLIAGMTAYIYKMMPAKILMDSAILVDGCDCYVRMFSYIVDRIYKITSVQTIKKRIDYAIGIYYQTSILGRPISQSVSTAVKKIVDIEDNDARIADMLFTPEDFTSLDKFLRALSRAFQLKDFKIDVFVSMWISAFGTGTLFAIEYFPSFSMVLTNSYIGGYIDNQNMIEKLCGNSLISFCKAILKIGEAVS